MNQICGDLLTEAKSLYYLLFYLEAALFMLFLFSLVLVGMIRPEQEDDDDSDSSSDSGNEK
jgi:nucleoside permease NupC